MEAMDPRGFKVMHTGLTQSVSDNCPKFVPWHFVMPHQERAKNNHGGQTLQRLAERGGLAPCELVAVLEDRDWHKMDNLVAVERIWILLREYTVRLGGI